jgi:hypothetical protein
MPDTNQHAAPTLYLHIGSQKTGSSYIQTSLRLSRQNLAEVGLIYPPGTEKQGLNERSWTAGNGVYLFGPSSKVKKYIETSIGDSVRGIVFSSETLLIGLSVQETRTTMLSTLRHFDIEHVKILLYLRNPMEFGVSYWMQLVKGERYIYDMETFLKDTGFIQKRMEMTAEVLDFLSGQDGFEITTLNYSHCKNDLLSNVSKWLEIDKDTLVIPSAEKVNRSLNPGETILQLELNKILGRDAIFLGKALSERITELETSKPSPSQELQERIWNETKPWIERVNRYLPPGQALVFDRMAPREDTGKYSFNEEQLKLIAQILGGEIRKTWDSETRLMAFYRRMSKRIRKTFHQEAEH